MTSEISRTKLAFQPLRATTEDIERAKNTLMLAHNTEMQSGAALLAKIDSVEKGMKTLDTRVKALVSGQENIDLLSVKRMRIKDAQGRERGFFGVRESNILDLSLKDDNGKARLSVTTGPNGIPSLYIRDAKEVTRVKLYEDHAGYAGIGLIDSNEKWRMLLATNPKDGRASLTLQNAEENGRVQLYENQSGYAGIGLIDSDKKWRMLLTTNPKGGRASLELWNAEGNSRVQLYESEAGDAGIRFTDNNKKQRMSLLTNPKDGRASLELRNAEGNNRVQLYENQFYFDGKDRFLQLPSPQAGAR